MARASLEELRRDYEDFLRQRGLAQWVREDPRRADLIARRCRTADAVAAWAKDVHDGRCGPCGRRGQKGEGRAGGASTLSTKSTASTRSGPTYAEISANGALALLAVACPLLDRQLAAQAAAFEKDGGFTERLYRMRSDRRRRSCAPEGN